MLYSPALKTPLKPCSNVDGARFTPFGTKSHFVKLRKAKHRQSTIKNLVGQPNPFRLTRGNLKTYSKPYRTRLSGIFTTCVSSSYVLQKNLFCPTTSNKNTGKKCDSIKAHPSKPPCLNLPFQMWNMSKLAHISKSIKWRLIFNVRFYQVQRLGFVRFWMSTIVNILTLTLSDLKSNRDGF